MPVQGGRSKFSLRDKPPGWEYFLQGGCILTWLHFFCGKCWLMYTIPWNSMGTGTHHQKGPCSKRSTLAYQSVSNYSLPRWVVKGVQMVSYIEAPWVSEKQHFFAIKQNWKVSIEIPWW